eukprot:bmy_00347T0
MHSHGKLRIPHCWGHPQTLVLWFISTKKTASGFLGILGCVSHGCPALSRGQCRPGGKSEAVTSSEVTALGSKLEGPRFGDPSALHSRFCRPPPIWPYSRGLAFSIFMLCQFVLINKMEYTYLLKTLTDNSFAP